MNSYTQILYYIKSLGELDPFVENVTQGELNKSQLDKKNLYPLLHIDIGNASFPADSVIQYNIELTCVTNRNTNKEILTDKFWKQDNEVDNFNETMAVLNRLWLLMLKDFEDNNITASENPNLNKITEAYGNSVDGWMLTFDIQVPNTEINLV